MEDEITFATKNDLEKLFLYVTGEDPICRRGNKRKFINASSGYSTCGGFCEYAREDLSKKKLSISEEKKKLINEKRKKPCIERFGKTTNLKTDETKERIRQTCLKKYGIVDK